MHDVRAITTAIVRGDADAFSRLYTDRFDFVFALLRRWTRLPEADCLDIAQDAFLRMIRRMPILDDADALDRWIARVARNAALDHLRAEQRRRARALRAHPRPTPASPPDAAPERDESLASLRRALEAMDDDTAAMIRLREGAGMTLASIGRLFGLTPGAAHARIARALRAAATAPDPNDQPRA